MDQRRKREVSAIEAAQGAFGIERPRDRDDRKQTTIRSVTPDEPPIPEDGLAPQSFSPPNSPHSHNSQLSAARSANPRAFVARASSDSDYRNAREPTRPRTRTLEERTSRDRSPSTVFATQGRHRIGSVASSQSNYQSLEESVVTSIGHISTISPSSSTHQPPPRTSSTNSRGRLVKQQQQQAQPRSQSPVISPTTVPPESWLSPVPASDARKLKALMRSTCGKMHGLLAFRRGEQNPWALSYCYINDEAGSLVYEPKNDVSYTRTLIPDLRGCHVKSAYDGEAYTAYIHVVVHNSKLEVHLRPPTQEEFDSWFAALLCWSPMRPKGIQNRMAKPQTPVMMERRLTDSRRHSEVSLLKDSPKKEAPIIKVGKMIYWDTSVTYSNTGTPKSAGPNGRPQAYRLQSHGSRRWRRVSCTLRENGELKLYSDTDVTLVSTIQLSQLSRCAVQRLDPSVLDNEFCIAIYPQYTAASSSSLSIVRPIFLSLDSRVLYEVWIVLLRAFTVPQLYGPKSDAITEDGTLSPTFGTQDMFRMEKSLFVRVIEAKLIPPVSPKVADNNGTTPIRPSSSATANPGGYLVELLLDGETRARTMVKNEGNNPFWREEFEFLDLPALHTASLLLKKRPPSYSTRNDKNVFEAPIGNDSWVTEGGYAGISFDQTLGKTDIYLDDLGPNQEMEKWWPLVNMHGNTIGEVLVKVSSEECAILMARDYYPLSELLHRFSNGITLQVAQMIPNELRRLSEYLLNIFQVSGAAVEWICALVEEEIDGTLKESPASRLRFSKRLGSSESNESPSNTFGSASDRELFVRDMGNNAKLEANLLFRGNTLLTKSLDLHMKRLGKEYLEETLSEKLREINDKDPECEVDPNKVSSQHELDRNWRRLINCTEEVWRSIYNSVQRCPQELRLIFRHIRACADDRYGDYLRTVQYSSVSGFLFLRFFVPAVLNPKLFGLLKGLANMSSFGTKEAWMEPMNAFLTSHRQEFKKYLDDICSISTTSQPAQPIPPSYSTPIAILHRLPPTFKEGFPSLPYLIDHSRNFAMLVNLWLEHTQKSAHDIQSTDGDLLRFHNICLSLSERTKDCLNRAEPAERPSSSLSVKWEELVEQLQGVQIDTTRGAATRNRGPIQEEEYEDSSLYPSNGDEYQSSSTSTPITMQPPPRTRHQQNTSISASQSSLKSNSSTTISYTNPFSKKQWSGQYVAGSHDSVGASPSASASASASAAEDTPPGSSDGLHMAPAPSYPQALTTTTTTTISTSTSTQSFNYSNPNSHINANSLISSNMHMNTVSTNSLAGRPPRSAGGQSVEGSDSGSIVEEEYTTALPVFSEKSTKEKKERGFRGVLPFQRKSKRKDKDKDKEKEKENRKDKGKDKDRDRDKDRSQDRSPERGGGGGGGDMGILRGKSSNMRGDERERDEEF
ncbi:hypothetical protein J3E72DRAFT_235070 [Bipolaris maydis]|nr:hypothetical protein J3E74DRAFT_259200 [Bipolaris maydis]KAJ6200191.1 hypothetical protein J3E72DRAFT_235070 [Bipolaris maydis]KAJ6213984.1 hypothetical protein PSV09DRAFT_2233763 [Bipolaris maydis]